MASSARPETLALQRLYQWEQTTPDKTVFTQPMGGGVVREWTWKQAMDEVRRMAAYLKGLNLEPGSRIAMLAKNTAHWMMADWAIWMAGHVSVPLYPTLAANSVRQILEHSESRLLFVGKLDLWHSMKPGVPEGLPLIALPLAPPVDGARSWDDILARTPPLADNPVRDADELCSLIYTSGTTGRPKGVKVPLPVEEAIDATNNLVVLASMAFGINADSIYLSPAPLYHAAPLRWSRGVPSTNTVHRSGTRSAKMRCGAFTLPSGRSTCRRAAWPMRASSAAGSLLGFKLFLASQGSFRGGQAEVSGYSGSAVPSRCQGDRERGPQARTRSPPRRFRWRRLSRSLRCRGPACRALL